MILTEKERMVIIAALTELDIKLSKGLSNSGIEQETIRQLDEIRFFHESDVVSTLRKIEKNKAEICRYLQTPDFQTLYLTSCGKEVYIATDEVHEFCKYCGGLVEELDENVCCLNEKRNMNGGCDSCRDPCL